MGTAALPAGLIDTDVLIDAERGVPQAVGFSTSQQAAGGPIVSVISVMEMIVGCRNKRDLATLTQLLQYVTVLQVTPAISCQAQNWMESYFLSHGLLTADALIAATAMEHQLPLYTKNVKHFQMLSGLAVVRPY